MQEEQKKKSLAIVAMGASIRDFMYYNFDKKHDRPVTDEVWCINSAALFMKCDMAVMMDDFKELEGRLPGYVKRVMTEVDCPVLTSRAYPEFPKLLEYPLAEVLERFQVRYLNGSVAYALAYALLKGYTDIILYGCDYVYDNKPGVYEKGRGCLEFWIALGTFVCNAHISVAQSSTLMDSNNPRFYGYREQPEFKVSKGEDGQAKVTFVKWLPEAVKEEQKVEGK